MLARINHSNRVHESYHSVNTTTVAGLDEQLNVSVHERNSHSNIRTVRQDKVGVLAVTLDEREDVVPTTTVETGAVVAELVNNLIHLKSSSDSFNQHSTTDGTPGNTNVVLSKVEDIVPQTGLEVRLHLGQVKVRTVPTGNQLLGVVEEVETEVEQRSGDGFAVNGEVLLIQVPATSTGNQRRQRPVCPQLVLLVALLEVHLATDRVVQVDLAVDHVVPGGRARVLKVSHVGPDVRVERVHDHLAVGRAGDLDAAVDQTGSWGSALPCVILSDVLGLGEEVEQVALVNLGLAVDTALQEGLAGRVEGTVEDGEESTSILGEDLAGIIIESSEDGDVLELSVDVNHFESLARCSIQRKG